MISLQMVNSLCSTASEELVGFCGGDDGGIAKWRQQKEGTAALQVKSHSALTLLQLQSTR